MIASEPITEADEDAWLSLREQGMTLKAIAADVGRKLTAVHTGIRHAKQRKQDGQTGRHAKAFGLVPIFGASCKPLALLKCVDVHPCRVCRGKGTTRLVACPECPGDGCVLCRGTGLVTLPEEIACEACGGSGEGDIPIGSRCCCMVSSCHKSGLDHRPGYTMTAAERALADRDRARSKGDPGRTSEAVSRSRRRKRPA